MGKLGYKAILLDMNETFMFGGDRFKNNADFFSTYSEVGGTELTSVAVNNAIRRCYDGMRSDYSNPDKFDDFPSIKEGLSNFSGFDSLDTFYLEATFAKHEMGQVPREFSACLKRLSRSYRLGLVSNIWAKKTPWLDHFADVGVDQVWSSIVFSSDCRSMKPSPALFLQALSELNVAPSEALFVGDSLEIDILPAKALGMHTAWVGQAACSHAAADYVALSLLEIEKRLQ